MNCETLAGKFLLLDTNVLIYFTKYPPFMAGLIERLQAAKVNLVLDDLVKFEFLRKADSPTEEGVLKDYLIKLFGIDEKELNEVQFPLRSDAIRSATEIATLYSSRLKNVRIELTDCFLAGQMKKYNEANDQLYLATMNHKHFPQLLFERVGIETIDLKEEIINIGFYMFNRTRFLKERKLYLAEK